MEGIKNDEKKLRWDLLDYSQIEKVVDILTFGAAKYADHNWKSVTPFKERYFAALMRHLVASQNGEKYDQESGRSHLSHVATNLHFLMWGEDNLWNIENLRIGLDIDGVLADFNNAAMLRFDIKDPNWWKYSYKFNSGEIWKQLDVDKDFWLGLQPLTDPRYMPFEPTCYITSRIHLDWTMEWLENNGFATKPVLMASKNKSDIIKERNLDVFVDDKIEFYLDAKKLGIKSFLMDQPWNQRYDVGNDRIISLNDLKYKL
jgi:uncharacterized HAD superfamily protein